LFYFSIVSYEYMCLTFDCRWPLSRPPSTWRPV
jgi:hypothetical protein